MLLHQLISAAVPIVSVSDDAAAIADLWEQAGTEQLPLIHNGHYLGLLRKGDAVSANGSDEGRQMLAFRPAVQLNAHPFDAMRIMHEHDLDVLPVIFDEEEYAGCITQESLILFLAELINVDAQSGIIILEMNLRDFSLSQIARICENEQVQLSSVFTKSNAATGKLEVTLKTNTTDLSALLQSLERFEYVILETFGDKKVDNDIVDRYKLLMNYINM